MGVISAALSAAFAALADTSLPAAWKHWHYSRAIELATPDAATGTTTAVGQLASVVAPPDFVCARADGAGRLARD